MKTGRSKQSWSLLSQLISSQNVDAVSVQANTDVPADLKDVLAFVKELERSRASPKRAWETLLEIKWALKDIAGIEVPPAQTKSIDADGRVVEKAVRKALKESQGALTRLVTAMTGNFRCVDDPVASPYVSEEAGTHRYNVGTDTPKLCATSCGSVPLTNNFLAA